MTADIKMAEPVASTSKLPTGNAEGVLASRTQAKKRRIPGACDICKRKKSKRGPNSPMTRADGRAPGPRTSVRCDSGELPGNRCSNCIQLGLECTHKEVTKVRPIIIITVMTARQFPRLVWLIAFSGFDSYVESLEMRLEKMDRLLRRLLPGVDLNQELSKPSEPAPSPKPLERNDETEVLGKLNRLTLNPQERRFFGKSSQYDLLQTALDLRQEFTGEGVAYVQSALPMKRPEFWDVPKWMSYNPELDEDQREYAFPDEDLYPSLVNAYFTHINPFLPLLHRPTFEKQIKDGLHLEDSMFARVFLMVCAHGARYSDDPRVFPEGTTSTCSAGWQWFEQVHILRKNLFNRTTLFELQMHALHVLFASSSETPQGVWAQIGMALRLSQEVGGHLRRRRKDGTPPTIEDELWKRAFWVILSLDRLISSSAGRPCGLQDEDFDLDLPLEVDDEYWDQGFVQPEGQPSSVSYFNCYLGLMDILAYAMRLIYPSKRSKYAGKTRSEQQIIAELDTAMNNWMDSLPEHLKWNPGPKNPLFLQQSSALHATYYHIQILIHRPFIPSPRNPIPGAFPSLAICTNAARSCCHVLEGFTKINFLPTQHFQVIAFTAAVILLLNIWSGKRTGFAPNPRREMEDVSRCMEMLKAAEKRSASAGRFVDLLTEVASAGDLEAAIKRNASTTKKSKKRSRSDSEDADDASSTSSVTSGSPVLSEARNIAGSRRVSLSQQTSPISPVEPPINFLLPMYGNDLGRLPVYGQFNFADPSNVNAFLGEQLGQIHTSVPTKTSYHFDQPPAAPTSNPPPNPMTLTSDPASAIFTSAADDFAFDNMLKDAMFSCDVIPPSFNPAPQAGTSSSPQTASTSSAGSSSSAASTSAPQLPNLPPLTMSTTDIAALIMQCSGVDYTALLQQLSMLSQLQMQMQLQQPMWDMEMMKLWSSAPANLELNDWDAFISNVGQLTQSQAPT
ncbi:nucleus protein [Coprinopsis cinerea okayama7|uniref:Nucleus protein n=1 Tax=Coprinopsis cinerea (strain Okayama-7 / 130 / ATCC MYA-4618 / FGSC 9003) TaxID=240176 RepID=A8N7L8_COPC7|nr:nucleus protein [Coprinopsis cinerea okayama7\|eukprot:XP_001830824.1 nucleus protein [Coprinopsis cinerea okayama7\